MDLFKQFFLTAKDDINAAITLHEKEMYPLSIYHLQQAVEKLSKSFGLKSGFIEKKDLKKKVSHDTVSIFRKAANHTHHNAEQMLFDFRNIFPDLIGGEDIYDELLIHEKTARKSKNLIGNLNSKDYEFLDEESIDDSLSQIKNTLNLSPFDIVNLEKNRPHFYNSISQKLEKTAGMSKADFYRSIQSKNGKSQFDNFVVFYSASFGKMLYVYYALFGLSLIFGAHNQDTRYPCIECGALPTENYPADGSLSIKFKEFVEVLKNTSNYYEELFLTS